MGTCMYSTSARVTSTLATSRRFIKAGNMMRSSYLSCHIPEYLLATTTLEVMKTPMNQNNTEYPRGRVDFQGSGLA